MAYPFLTAKPAQGRPGIDSISLSMVTDSDHSTQSSLRLTLYSDSGRTNSVGTDSAFSTNGSVQERLVCTVSGSLDPDTTYYPKLEYEETAGSGTWVEITDVTDDVTCRTQPGVNDEFRMAVASDPHINPADFDSVTNKRTRFNNCLDAIAAFDPHVLLNGGDQHISGHFSTEQDAWDWGLEYHDECEVINDFCPQVWTKGNHDDTDGSQEDYTPSGTNVRKLFMLNPNGDDSNEIYGKFTNGVASVVYVEPYSESGYPVTDNNIDTEISSTQLSLVTNTISGNTKPWLIIHCHGCASEGIYDWLGCDERIQSGKQSETIHNAIVTHMSSRPATVGVIVLMGHTHRFEHTIRDGVHYVNAGTMCRTFAHSASSLVDMGYYLNEDGDTPRSSKYQESMHGFVALTLTKEWGKIEFVRTTTEDSGGDLVEPDDTVRFTANPTGMVIGEDRRFFAGKVGQSSEFWTGNNW